MNKIGLISWLEESLKERNMNQAALAKKSGISPAHISRIMSGEQSPGIETVVMIAKGLNLRPEEVFLQAAGLLPEKKSEDHFAKEAEYLVSLLPAVQKAIAVNYLRFLVAEAEKEKSK